MNIKPAKPYPDFPLYPHSSGKWAKKIGGKIYYFGRWDDWEEAYKAYEALHSGGRTLQELTSALSLGDALGDFLETKKAKEESGELSPRTFIEYQRTARRFAAKFGRERPVKSLAPPDFASYKTDCDAKWNLIVVGNEVTRVRTIFKWIREYHKVDVSLGPDFKKASSKAMRKLRRETGTKLFSAEEIQRLMDFSGVQMRAMILLGINCGFGPTDCATLPLTALDGGWVRYPRPKTEVDRHIPLWPETVEALRVVIKRRYKTKNNRVFVRHNGGDWEGQNNYISKCFRQIYLLAGLKKGGHYWLRHTFETIAGESTDQVAVNAVMGHVDASMAAVYREGISDARLRAVVEVVRQWLFGAV